jgi:DNA-binding GntR family transcriptional regulator
MSGELAPGEPLIESSLAAWCEVSRTPIREALKRLQQDGLVRRGDHGLVVRERSPEEILDIYDVRIVLESRAAAAAAERRSAIDLLTMRKMAERNYQAEAAERQALADTNRDFHRAVWHASHNEALIDLLERLSLHLGRYPATTLAHPGRHEAGYKEHLMMITAIEERDADGAAEHAARHFSAAREIRLRLWEDGEG